MASNEFSYLRITDVRGGMNNTDEPQSLEDNQVVDARNIDWMQGTMGGKRSGCIGLTIDNSVFNIVVPLLVSSTTGGGTGVAALNIVVPAIPDDGTGNTYVGMAVFACTKNGANDITNITYRGGALTQQAQSASGASGRVEVWTMMSPNLAGGTVALTLAGVSDVSAVVVVWGRVQSVTASFNNAGASTNPIMTATPVDPTVVVIDAVSFDTGVTATVGGFQTQTSNQSNGQSRLATSYELGRKPSTIMDWTLSGSKDWAGVAVTFKGAPLSAFSTAVTLVWLGRFTKTNNPSEDELWAVDNFGRFDRRVGGTWQLGVPIVNQFVGIFDLTGLDINGASLHGKYFIAAQASAISGLLVWDGTALRNGGFPFTPTVPTAANTVGAGTYSGTRYFRIRFTEQVGGATVRRSEPSPVQVFAPSGANTGAVVTKPAGTEDFSSVYQNGQTHWELEASLDNVIFYRIATVAVGTPTFTDTTALATGYSAFPVSDAIGEYVSLPPARHVAVDDDRLVLGGNRVLPAFDSRVYWTPVAAAPGVGNDERIPATTGNFLDLDGLDGGNIQMLITGETGSIYAFKLERTYKLIRTGVVTAAYVPQTESRSRGATKRAACSGHDEEGTPCVYFTDPSVGLCRAGKRGIEQLGEDVLSTWEGVTLSAPSSAFGPRLLYWPQKSQVMIAIGTGGFGHANKLLVYNTKFRSFALYESPFITGGFIEGVMFPDNGPSLLPYWATDLAPTLVKFTTTAINDAGFRYRAYWTSKAYLLAGLYARFGAMAGVIFATATAATTIGIGLIRNLGFARRDVTVNIAPIGSETHVFKTVDNATMSECKAIQFEFGDPSSFSGAQLDQTWSLNEYSARMRSEEEG